jgi:hypothetical protein
MLAELKAALPRAGVGEKPRAREHRELIEMRTEAARGRKQRVATGVTRCCSLAARSPRVVGAAFPAARSTVPVACHPTPGWRDRPGGPTARRELRSCPLLP